MNTVQVLIWFVVGLVPSTLTWQQQSHHRKHLHLQALWWALEVETQAHRLRSLSLRLPLLELAGKPLWWLLQQWLDASSR